MINSTLSRSNFLAVHFVLIDLSSSVPFPSHSAEPDAGGPAGNDQGAGRRPACRHRGSDQRHVTAVCDQGELPHVGCFPGQL